MSVLAADSEKTWLLAEARKIASALAATLSPLCEVVVHDLTDPAHTIVYIANNLSGRAVGDSATELGLARMADPTFPDVIANYAGTFPDGRPAKSTSIGLKDRSGKFIAAICLNIDLSYLRGVSSYIDALTKTQPNETGVVEHLTARRAEALETKILEFASARNREPRALTSDDKRALINQLATEGELEIRGAADRIGALVGLSRSNVYYYLGAARSSKRNTHSLSRKR